MQIYTSPIITPVSTLFNRSDFPDTNNRNKIPHVSNKPMAGVNVRKGYITPINKPEIMAEVPNSESSIDISGFIS
jgi:hypothetical protein